jgi:diaminohydroxyphosphoribosylaminopyrimidine deaminase/5-amino-6-(5-phosphoribosylamino)uracil reductase
MSAETDRRLMRRAIGLARRCLGSTWPNPAVGCVIARGGEVLAEAGTGPGGSASAGHRLHAEERALTEVGAAAKGAAAYITLEPCTLRSAARASCTDRLIAGGVGRVAVACLDPSPLAAGEGLERLRQAGIAVEVGLLADEAMDVYAGYRRRLATGRPLIQASDTGAGFDAAFEPSPSESLRQALQRLGDIGYTRLWVERGGMLERALRDQGLLD